MITNRKVNLNRYKEDNKAFYKTFRISKIKCTRVNKSLILIILNLVVKKHVKDNKLFQDIKQKQKKSNKNGNNREKICLKVIYIHLKELI